MSTKVTTPGIANDSVTAEKLADDSLTTDKITFENSLVPTGAVFHFASASAPVGYLICDGSTIPNGEGTIQDITANFSALYAIIGSTYGSAGKLPDLRGEFIRGWDAGRGADSNRGFGSSQSWAIQNITGSYSGESSGIASGAFYDVYGGDGGFIGAGTQPTGWAFDASRVVQTSTETRPRNIALLPYIKY